MEQFVRDARITQIYEGTNGIQGAGFWLAVKCGRIWPSDAAVFSILLQISWQRKKTTALLAEFLPYFMSAFGKLQMSTLTVATRGFGNPDEAGAAASDYLKLFALVAGRFHVAEDGEGSGH